MSRDHKPVTISKFGGLWARNPVIETCPDDHFVDCLNTAHNRGGGVKQRPGFPQLTNFGTNIARMVFYQTRNELDALGSISYSRPIVILDTGALLDYYRFPAAAPLITVGAGKVISTASIFGRLYISFRDPAPTSIPLNAAVYIYNGIHPASGGIFRGIGSAPLAVNYAGSALVGGPYVGNNARIVFGVATENDTGYIIPPSNYQVTPVGSPDPNWWGNAGYNLFFATGPAGTVARHIIASKAITGAYSGNPLDYPLYRVTRIPDNVTVNYNFATSGLPPNYSWDNYLNVTADDLINQLDPVLGGINLIEYNGRLVVLGPYDDRNLIRVSKSGEPESFSATSGFKITDMTDPTGVKNAVVFNGNLYLFKTRRTIVTRDNGDEVSTWDMEVIDPAIGTGPLGIASILSHKGSGPEGFLVASQSGIFLFNGVYQKPELTYKIENLWSRINITYFDIVELAIDPIKKIIYCGIPIDGAASVNALIVGDYNEGMDPKTIKWSLWKFLDTGPTGGILVYDTPSAAPLPVTLMAVGARTIYRDDAALVDIGGTAFSSEFVFSHIRPYHGLSHFNKINIRASGTGGITFQFYTKDVVALSSQFTHNLGDLGRERDYLLNHINEELRIRVLSVGSPDYEVKRLDVFYSPIWNERPRV